MVRMVKRYIYLHWFMSILYVVKGSGLGFFKTQALYPIFQIPAIPVIESTAVNSQLFQSLSDKTLWVFYDPNDLQFLWWTMSHISMSSKSVHSGFFKELDSLEWSPLWGILLTGSTTNVLKHWFTSYFLVHNNLL